MNNLSQSFEKSNEEVSKCLKPEKLHNDNCIKSDIELEKGKHLHIWFKSLN